MAALWVAAAILAGAAATALGWGINHSTPGWRATGLIVAVMALIGLAFVVYAMLAFCEAPPGSACA
ncbi:MAG TPA: hypothetical protein VL687_06670 [Methylomirabilota bacterium]|jgi:hypothetical protein|nr:hypothetical protein [Methylomirabilota bacterium]